MRGRMPALGLSSTILQLHYILSTCSIRRIHGRFNLGAVYGEQLDSRRSRSGQRLMLPYSGALSYCRKVVVAINHQHDSGPSGVAKHMAMYVTVPALPCPLSPPAHAPMTC